jgi:hypothetical protein
VLQAEALALTPTLTPTPMPMLMPTPRPCRASALGLARQLPPQWVSQLALPKLQPPL